MHQLPLMFKGTPSHRNIPDELSKHGAMPNGQTNDDRTSYFEMFSASDENFDWAPNPLAITLFFEFAG